MRQWQVARFGVLAVMLVAMTACSKVIPGMKPAAKKEEPPPKPRPLPVNFTIEASATVNPSETNRPSPVVVRVYQLRADQPFRSVVAYERLYADDRAALGETFIERVAAATLRPGERTTVSVDFNQDVRFVGIAAFFRDYDTAQWRVVIPAPLKGDGTILVDRNSVSYTPK